MQDLKEESRDRSSRQQTSHLDLLELEKSQKQKDHSLIEHFGLPQNLIMLYLRHMNKVGPSSHDTLTPSH